jgi:hypothetical protein
MEQLVQSLSEKLLSASDLRDVSRVVARQGVCAKEIAGLLAAIGDDEASHLAVMNFAERLIEQGVPSGDGAIERFLLLSAAWVYAGRIAAVTLDDEVRANLLKAIELFGSPGPLCSDSLCRRVGHSHFAAMCKVVTARRFPAGAFDWEVAGFPMSWFLRVRKRDLPRVVWTLISETGGRAPMMASHYSVCRRPRLSMLREDVFASWRLMARNVALQPEIRGLLIDGWLLSPEVHRVSPHLAWFNEPFIESRALLTDLGDAPPDCGVFQGNRRRRELFEAGTFRPTIGVAIWPRDRLLEWAGRR